MEVETDPEDPERLWHGRKKKRKRKEGKSSRSAPDFVWWRGRGKPGRARQRVLVCCVIVFYMRVVGEEIQAVKRAGVEKQRERAVRLGFGC